MATAVWDSGAVALADCPGLAGLTEQQLHLHESSLTDAGALAILNSPYLRNVHSISFWRNPHITDIAVRALQPTDVSGKKVEWAIRPRRERFVQRSQPDVRGSRLR